MKRAEFIETIRSALGRPGKSVPDAAAVFAPSEDLPVEPELERIAHRSPSERQALLEHLIAEGAGIRVQVMPVADVLQARTRIVALIRQKTPEWGSEKRVLCWRHPLIEQLALEKALSEDEIAVDTANPSKMSRSQFRERAAGAFVGITSADYCLSDTATLVLRTRPGQARAVSLLPLIHIAVIEQSQVIRDLRELYLLLNHDPRERREGLTTCMSFITGPSKTGDIEMRIVHGVHGPRELVLLVIKGSG